MGKDEVERRPWPKYTTACPSNLLRTPKARLLSRCDGDDGQHQPRSTRYKHLPSTSFQQVSHHKDTSRQNTAMTWLRYMPALHIPFLCTCSAEPRSKEEGENVKLQSVFGLRNKCFRDDVGLRNKCFRDDVGLRNVAEMTSFLSGLRNVSLGH
jgi:hypothetical protein